VFPAILAAVAFLLALACANIANLSLARGQDRIREFRIRASLGAARGRLIRQLLAESLLLACTGGAIGAALSCLALGVVRPLIPAGYPRLDAVGLDLRVLAIAAAVTVLAGLVTGLWPAFRLASLKFSGRRRTISVLIVAEIAVGLVLLSGAILSVGSLYRLLRVDSGFETASLLALELTLPRPAYNDPARRAVAIQELLRTVSAAPGVSSSAISDFRPLGSMMNVIVERPGVTGPKAITAEAIAGPYLDLMHIPLLAGRTFATADAATSERVAIVNQRAASALWPGEQPLGKEFRTVGPLGATYRVVGIARDIRRDGPDREAQPHFYSAAAQNPPYRVELVVRSQPGLDPAILLPALRVAVASADKTLAIREAVVMADAMERKLQRPRLLAFLLGGFGGLALILTALGIYGTVSYAVEQRRHEIGIRMAVGATPAAIQRLFLGRGIALTCLGLAIGAAGIWWLSRLLTGMLYGVEPLDPVSNLLAALGLLATALTATALPARRAAQTTPTLN